jgi:formylglycine-generating enzyme required for sulfatase activity
MPQPKFRKFTMRQLLSFVIAITCIAVMQPQALAAPKPGKAIKPVKERLVLMPLRVPDEDKSLAGSMEAALVEGLQQNYEVFSGEQVAQKAKAIFNKESRNTTNKECDETKCMQDIAIAFQAEHIATANVTKRADGYFLALSIQNIFDNKVVHSKSTPCKNCDAYQVVEKLKEISGAKVQASSAQSDNSPTPARSITLPAVPPAARVTGNPNDAETQVWAEVVAGNKIDDYKFYLDNYPQGKFVKQATEQKQKLETYAMVKADAVVAQENEQAWNTAQQGNSVASYSKYLIQYPKGSYAALAKIKKSKAVVAEEVAAKASATKAILGIAANMVVIPGKSYELGKYEVTQFEWKAVMGSNPSNFISCGDPCPVEQVSWDVVQIFIAKLNAMTGRKYRLPTEAEWEYACYGGSKTEYCGGDNVDSVAWYKSNSDMKTHPVGQKQANGYGLYDMSGNVWELQTDCWENNCAHGRVLRGGSWNFEPQGARAAIRDRYGPADRTSIRGFRIARTLP